MCCERLQSSALSAAENLPNGHPDKDRMSIVVAKVVVNCPKETHTGRLAGTPRKPESEVIPAFFRNFPDETDLLEAYGALEPLLK